MFLFQTKLQTLSRDTLEEIVLTAISLHPDILTLLDQDQEPPPPPPDSEDTPPWCNCGKCCPMPTPEEELCCRRRPGNCITVTAANVFATAILDRTVLDVAIRNRNDLFVLNDLPTNSHLRNAAYRQYVLWKFGHLGAGNRVVVPSCVVWEVRRAMPEAGGQYTGFRPGRFA